jgi:nucleoside-diphosphate-sugar epimerase
MAAVAAGEARIAALRAPDFYGPGVGNSYLGDTSIGKLAQGKPAVFIGSPDVLHDYAYVPDIARAARRCSPRPTRPSARPGTFPAPPSERHATSSRSPPTRSP